MAELVAAGAVDSPYVPALHFDSIQTSGVALSRWTPRHVCLAPDSLYVLLAAILLVFPASRGMTIREHDSNPASNDVLHSPVTEYPIPVLYYQIVAQNAEDVQNIENAPAISMGPYLLASGQIRLLTSISVYSLPGGSREQIRLLYMNAAAIQVWKEMGKAPKIIGAQVRPPRTALLAYGVPFSM